MHLALDESFDRNGLINVVAREGILKNLEVLDVGVFGVNVELDSGHGYVQEDAIEDLAEGRPGTALFDFGDIKLEQVV